MEWLGHVKVVSVTGSHLVGVGVLLVDPVRSIPQLAVTLIARGIGVRSLMHLQLGTSLKGERVVTVPPVGSVMH